MKNIIEVKAKRNILQLDLRSPKYRERVVMSKKNYNRKKLKKGELENEFRNI